MQQRRKTRKSVIKHVNNEMRRFKTWWHLFARGINKSSLLLSCWKNMQHKAQGKQKGGERST
jgi:hypothetical protein